MSRKTRFEERSFLPASLPRKQAALLARLAKQRGESTAETIDFIVDTGLSHVLDDAAIEAANERALGPHSDAEHRRLQAKKWISSIDPDEVRKRLGTTEIELGRVCRRLDIRRLEVAAPDNRVDDVEDRLTGLPVRVFVSFGSEPSTEESNRILGAVEERLGHLFDRSVTAVSCEVLDDDTDRCRRDEWLATLVQIYDAPTSSTQVRKTHPDASKGDAESTRGRRRRGFTVHVRTGMTGGVVVEIRYGKRAAAVVTETARIRRENTRGRWQEIAAADLADDEALLRRYRERLPFAHITDETNR